MEKDKDTSASSAISVAGSLSALTRDWGAQEAVSLYLERCQVDTPERLVETAWRHVCDYRDRLGFVVDFGAGDGRFAHQGNYDRYVGYEIDESRSGPVGPNSKIISACAFSDSIDDADLCIGNPPFVRNQDLPVGWRAKAAEILFDRTGVRLSGLANAWQYFFLLSLISIRPDGLCVLVIPYEWVSRPSAKAIRAYIQGNRWNVDVFKLVDETFDSVLTTASITIIDKSKGKARWRYFEETESGRYKRLKSPSGSSDGVLEYAKGTRSNSSLPRAKRGLSPGSQKVFVLTEGERVANGLKIGKDVVPCVTSLRPLPSDEPTLSEEVFDSNIRHAGHRCWLLRVDKKPSHRLNAYLDAVPENQRQTKTCADRDVWWQFKMPEAPDVLMAQTFKKNFPKAIRNEIAAIAVGGVCGVSNLTKPQVDQLILGFDGIDLSDKVVSYANSLHKLEINQLNWILNDRFGPDDEGAPSS